MREISEEEAAAFEVPASVDDGLPPVLNQWELTIEPSQWLTFSPPASGKVPITIILHGEGLEGVELSASVTPEDYAKIEAALNGRESGEE